MKKIVIGLTVVLLSLLIFGCKDINNPDTGAVKTENENQNEIENQKQVVNGGVLQGKALYSNSNDSSSIQVILDKTDGLFTEQLLELTNQTTNNDRSIVDPSRTVVSYQNCTKDGSYEFSNLEEGNYTVYAASPDSTEKAVFKSIVVGKDQTVQVPQMTLTATGAISGKITLDGSIDNNAGFVIFAGGTSFMAVTALDGSFTLSGLPANTSYQIIVMRGAYTHLWKNDEQAEPLGNTYIGELNLTSDTIKLTGKDGKNGTNGINGLNGIDGINGTNGTNGTDGKDGKDGISIIWKGSFPDASALSTPQYLWAYFNTTDGCSYIYDGHTWTLLASSGENKSESSNAKVMLTYNLSGGILPAGAPQVHTYGKVTQLMEPTRTGYHFEGFYFTSNFSGEPVTSLGNDYIIGQTLYAKWKQCKSVYYCAKIFGEYIDVKTEYYTDQEFETAVLSGYERAGYDFNGWNKNPNWVSDTYQPGTSLKTILINNQQSITLYAMSSPIEYTITYNCGSATNSANNPATYTVEQDITINDGTLNGDSFGWTIDGTSATCNGWLAGEQTGNITLSIDIQYRINYQLNHGTNDERNPDRYAPGQAVTLYQPTRQNYIFDGWFTTAEYSDTPLTGWAAGEKNQHITLYARWTNAVINRILNLTQSETITLTGEYTADDIAEIRRAMNELYRKNSSIGISLDLSNIQVEGSDLYFSGAQNLKGIVFPDYITSIPGHAFDGCGFESITIPSNVQTIGNYALANNENLVNITIEEGVSRISGYTFSGCKNLKEITLPSTITSITQSAFNNCESLERIIILSSTFIPINLNANWFSNCNSLRELYCLGLATSPSLPYSWEYIPIRSDRPPVITNDGYRFARQTGRWTLVGYQGTQTALVLPSSFQVSTTTITDFDINLSNYPDITSVTIPGNIETITDSAFRGCSNLSNVTICQGVKTIDSNAFSGCSKLTSVSIPSSVTYIRNEAFLGCNKLTNLTIPSGVTYIDSRAFFECTGLTNITIPPTVTNMEGSAFGNCTGLTNVTLSDGMTGTLKGFNGCTGITSITIPESVTSIGSSAFNGCTGLTNINIPSSVKTIGTNAFKDCTGIENATIGDGVLSINRSAFYNCTNLTSITIPSNVETIGQQAFACSGLQRVIILNPDISLGAYSFGDCPLYEFYILTPSFSDAYDIVNNESCFYSYPPIFSIKPPVETNEGFIFAYLRLWEEEIQEYEEKWTLINYIGNKTNITLPSSFESSGETITAYRIYSKAFENNITLTNVTISDNVTSIDDYSFSGCSNLTTVTIPECCINDNNYSYYERIKFKRIFSECPSLTNVILHDGITTIPEDAFYKCTNLSSITIPESVERIAAGAFYYCSGLTNIIIPDSVVYIGSSAFAGCSALTSISIPNNVAIVGDYAFSNCTNLVTATIPVCCLKYNESEADPYTNSSYDNKFRQIFSSCEKLSTVILKDGITTIPEDAFCYCSSLTSITIPDSVTSIGGSAFSGCSGLTSFSIPDSVTSIGGSAFYNCSGLTSITMSNSITSIGYSVFQGCSGLKSITIPDDVTTIGGSAFSGCSGLTNITIPDSVTSIGDSAFDSCSNLKSISIPIGCTNIGTYIFKNCTNLETATISDIFLTNNYPYRYTDTFSNCPKLTNIIIQEGTTNIPNYAFSYNTTLTSVVIPESVTEIGDCAFYNCIALSSVTLTDNITSIGASAFTNCSSLTELTIPNSITALPDNIFAGCSSLNNVILPDSVTEIGSEAFKDCTSLTEIDIPYGTTSLLGTFSGCTSLSNVTIPNSVTKLDKRVSNYDYEYGTFYNCSSLTTLTIPEGVTTIGSYTFRGCSNLTSIVLPDTVKTIGSHAFEGCSKLTNISIPCNVTSVGNAFDGCTSLKSATIPKCVMNAFNQPDIFYNTFSNCPNLTSITIQNGITEIPDYAFKDCTTLTTIIIPESVTKIWDYAFYGCTGITSIIIPSNVEWIGNRVFSGCTNLSSVTISEGVERMLNYTFEKCTSLSNITIPSSFTSIGDYSFTGCTNLSSVTFMSPDNWRFWDDSSTYIDCSNPETNALNLKSTYVSKQWVKRDN